MNEKICIVKHVEQEGPGALGDFFDHLGWESRIIELYRDATLPETLDDVAGVIVLGGPMNVYAEETYPFLKLEDPFIRKVVREEVPFLGICLGAQLLAKACGAPVRKAPHKEVGWFEVALTPHGQRNTLFRGLGATVQAFQWHEDTFEVPEGGVLLATSDLCRNQAFLVGSNAFGLQFHVEVTPAMVRSWAANAADAAEAERMGDGPMGGGRFEDQAKRIFLNFKRVLESSARLKRTIHSFVDAKRGEQVKLWWNLEKRTLQA